MVALAPTVASGMSPAPQGPCRRVPAARGPGSPRRGLHRPCMLRNRLSAPYGGTMMRHIAPLAYFQSGVNSYPMSASAGASRAGTRTVGVLGASGYAGAELLRLLARHPRLEVIWASGEASA